jgi:predicted PhzF superfamily epimerase YddE/YHI9
VSLVLLLLLLLLLLPTRAAVERLQPKQDLLAGIQTRGFIVTAGGACRRAPDAEFVSRFFGPRMGIPEDPATGSAQCALGPFWASRLGRRAGLRGFQASARGGHMTLSLQSTQGDNEELEAGEERVLVRSTAEVVIDGTIAIPG